jgi:hypothetical protein
MKTFPTICVDNFYKNPDKVREFALSLDYNGADNADGTYPGKRTQNLHKIDKEFFDKFCNKLMTLYFDFQTPVSWEINTSFQLIHPMADSPNDKKNHGWIHTDNAVLFGGIIYLTPNINPNCGTSIYRELYPAEDDEIVSLNNTKIKFYRDGEVEEHDNALEINNSRFVETARFDNIYNRLVAFDNTTNHGANNFYSDTEPRLTQVFFVYKIETSGKLPLERSNAICDL